VIEDRLKEELASRLLGWKAAPDRFLKSGRGWIPKWRFNPFTHLEDAFLLLDRAGGTYVLSVGSDGIFSAEVQIGEQIGKASGEPKALAITLALARSLGLEVDQ
jgi:hypothetical protein